MDNAYIRIESFACVYS